MQWITWMLLGAFAVVSAMAEWTFWSVGNPSEKAKHRQFQKVWYGVGTLCGVCWWAGYLF